MAGECIRVKVGGKLTVKDVRTGTKQDGTPWQQIHIVDETGKVEGGAFVVPPIDNLRDGDIIQVDEAEILIKRSANRYSYNTKTWEKLDNPKKFVTEPVSQIKAHIAVGGPFTYGGMDGGGLDAGFDPNEGELPF